MSGRLFSLLIRRSLGLIGTGASRRRILFQILMITLSLSALVFALIFVTSMSDAIANKYALLNSGHLIVHDRVFPTSASYDSHLVGTSYGLIYSKERTALVFLKGVEDDYLAGRRKDELTILEESGEPTTLMKVMISKSLAGTLGVRSGENLALMIGTEEHVRPTLVRVGAVYDSGYKELDELLVFTDLSSLVRLGGESVSFHHEVLLEMDRIEEVRNRLVGEGHRVTTWSDEAPLIAGNLITSKEATFIIIGLIGLLLGYATSELVRQMVEDDRRQITVLLLLGSRRRPVGLSYLVAVLIVTIIALILGTALGILLAHAVPKVLPLIEKRSLPLFSFYLLRFPVAVPTARILILGALVILSSAVTVFFSLRRALRRQKIGSLAYD
ncbi:MAG: FtsX-like permease family protein [Spirochaetales bacterium]|nr:FtsX-like permease family protein [Spirochaetales bacterium]